MSQLEIRRFENDSAGEACVRGYLHEPAARSGDGLVLTHGAGQNCEAPMLIALAEAFCDAGLAVLRCDLPFRQISPTGPPRWPGIAAQDRAGLKRAVEEVRKVAPCRVFLGGHSYGGRQASMLAAEEPGLVEALVLLSYPLHPPKQSAKLRTAHFPSLETAALFVSGTRDGFGTIEELAEHIKTIPARTELLSIAGAGHELMTLRNRAELPGVISKAFMKFADAKGAA